MRRLSLITLMVCEKKINLLTSGPNRRKEKKRSTRSISTSYTQSANQQFLNCSKRKKQPETPTKLQLKTRWHRSFYTPTSHIASPNSFNQNGLALDIIAPQTTRRPTLVLSFFCLSSISSILLLNTQLISSSQRARRSRDPKTPRPLQIRRHPQTFLFLFFKSAPLSRHLMALLQILLRPRSPPRAAPRPRQRIPPPNRHVLPPGL